MYNVKTILRFYFEKSKQNKFVLKSLVNGMLLINYITAGISVGILRYLFCCMDRILLQVQTRNRKCTNIPKTL